MDFHFISFHLIKSSVGVRSLSLGILFCSIALKSSRSGDSMVGIKKTVRFGENQEKEFTKTSRIIPNTDANKTRTQQRRKNPKQKNQEKTEMKSKKVAKASQEDKSNFESTTSSSHAKPSAARTSEEDKSNFEYTSSSSTDESKDHQAKPLRSILKKTAVLPTTKRKKKKKKKNSSKHTSEVASTVDDSRQIG